MQKTNLKTYSSFLVTQRQKSTHKQNKYSGRKIHKCYIYITIHLYNEHNLLTWKELGFFFQNHCSVSLFDI